MDTTAKPPLPPHVEHEGKKLFLNTRQPNEQLPKGYEEWLKWMQKENNTFVSCLDTYRDDLKG